MSMGKEKAELDAKIKMLNFRVKKTDKVLQKDDRAAVERHRASLESVVTAVMTLKESIEEQMFAEGKDDQAVQEWAEEFEESVDTGDKCMRQLASKIEQINRKSKHDAIIFEYKQAVALENKRSSNNEKRKSVRTQKSWPLSRRNSTCNKHKRSRRKPPERLAMLLKCRSL